MAKASGPQRPRRRFGRVRKLPSLRYQAGYLAPDGSVIYAEQTFPTKAMADRFLVLTESELMSGTWSSPERQRETVGEWANRWLESRTGLGCPHLRGLLLAARPTHTPRARHVHDRRLVGRGRTRLVCEHRSRTPPHRGQSLSPPLVEYEERG